MLAANPNLPIYVRSDKTVPYERVAIVMGLLNYAGIAKVALVFEPLPGK
jgi:biopolymer transport protein ExbD